MTGYSMTGKAKVQEKAQESDGEAAAVGAHDITEDKGLLDVTDSKTRTLSTSTRTVASWRRWGRYDKRPRW